MSKDVRDYYDRNTRGFLRLGGAGAATGSLHRSLRLPGTRGAEDAANAIHQVLLDILVARAEIRLRESGLVRREHDREVGRRGSHGDGASRASVSDPHARPPFVADLGCGVGATMTWISARAEVEMGGITLSEVQARLARRRLPAGSRVVAGSFVSEADLRRMAAGRSIHAAYMIESLSHSDRPDQLFAVLSRLTSRGAILVVCDDFPSPRLARQLATTGARDPESQAGRSKGERLSPEVRLNLRLAAEFRRGWHIHGFRTASELARLAEPLGWRAVETMDLSRAVITTRPRDLAARLGAGPARLLRSPSRWWENVIGGGALQRLIRRGLVRYQVLVFCRSG
jgi:hypothetical protein